MIIFLDVTSSAVEKLRSRENEIPAYAGMTKKKTRKDPACTQSSSAQAAGMTKKLQYKLWEKQERFFYFLQ